MKEAVQVVILNDAGYVLAVSRKHDHNNFGLVGGKVDKGESLEEAIIRETKEETGLDISNLTLVFSMHKDGYMGYTYLCGKWSGEINTEEPHIVKWSPFQRIIEGSFGKWNELVAESLTNMGVSFILHDHKDFQSYDWSYSRPKNEENIYYGLQSDWNVTIITVLNRALVLSEKNTKGILAKTFVPIKFEKILTTIISYSLHDTLFDRWKFIYINSDIDYIYSEELEFKINILDFILNN